MNAPPHAVVGAAPPVPSPCIRVCQLDPTGEVCTGCGRTLTEVRRWSTMTDEEKRAVNARVGFREGAAD